MDYFRINLLLSSLGFKLKHIFFTKISVLLQPEIEQKRSKVLYLCIQKLK